MQSGETPWDHISGNNLNSVVRDNFKSLYIVRLLNCIKDVFSLKSHHSPLPKPVKLPHKTDLTLLLHNSSLPSDQTCRDGHIFSRCLSAEVAALLVLTYMEPFSTKLNGTLLSTQLHQCAPGNTDEKLNDYSLLFNTLRGLTAAIHTHFVWYVQQLIVANVKPNFRSSLLCDSHY